MGGHLGDELPEHRDSVFGGIAYGSEELGDLTVLGPQDVDSLGHDFVLPALGAQDHDWTHGSRSAASAVDAGWAWRRWGP